MLVDVVRKLLVPGNEYEYLVYYCTSPYEGVEIAHVQTSGIDYDYAVAYIEEHCITVQLFPTEYLAEKTAELSEHNTQILKVRT